MDLSKFKQVPGWTEYLINKEGVLVSLKYDKEKVLKPRTQVNGYQVISFFRMENGEAIREQRLIHRLVMLMFGPDQPSETHRVHLMDFNLLNYGIHNLEWLEHSECTKRAWERNRKLGNKMGRQSRPIICTVNDKVVKHFESIKPSLLLFGHFHFSNYLQTENGLIVCIDKLIRLGGKDQKEFKYSYALIDPFDNSLEVYWKNKLYFHYSIMERKLTQHFKKRR